MDRTIEHGDHGWLRRAVIGTGMAASLTAAVIWMRFDDRSPSTMTLQTPKAAIRVEVAHTPAARSAGLSLRDILSDVDGLLLKWETPELPMTPEHVFDSI